MQNLQVINLPEYGKLFTIYNFFHNVLIVFAPPVAYLFWVFNIFSQKISDAYRVPYIAFLDYVYMHFTGMYIQMEYLL